MIERKQMIENKHMNEKTNDRKQQMNKRKPDERQRKAANKSDGRKKQMNRKHKNEQKQNKWANYTDERKKYRGKIDERKRNNWTGKKWTIEKDEWQTRQNNKHMNEKKVYMKINIWTKKKQVNGKERHR